MPLALRGSSGLAAGPAPARLPDRRPAPRTSWPRLIACGGGGVLGSHMVRIQSLGASTRGMHSCVRAVTARTPTGHALRASRAGTCWPCSGSHSGHVLQAHSPFKHCGQALGAHFQHARTCSCSPEPVRTRPARFAARKSAGYPCSRLFGRRSARPAPSACPDRTPRVHALCLARVPRLRAWTMCFECTPRVRMGVCRLGVSHSAHLCGHSFCLACLTHM